MNWLLGVDYGTTNVKCVAYDEDGRVGAAASGRTPMISEKPGQALYPAGEAWAATAGAIRRTVERLERPDRILGVAVASLGESVIPLDETGEALAPALAWFDERTRDVAGPWRDRDRAREVWRRAGVCVDYTFSAFKALWFKRERPDLYGRVRTWLAMADYLAFRLSGRAAFSEGLASRTMLLDLRRRDWSPELMREMGLDAAQWPAVRPSGDRLGSVTAEAAAATGLKAGTPVMVGGHDHVCGALAAGAVEPGVALNSMGTAEALGTSVAAPPDDPGLMDNGYNISCHAARGRYFVINGLWGSGALLEWLRRTFWGHLADDAQAYAALEAAAAASGAGAKGVRALPFFAGADPHLPSPDMRGALLGLMLHHGPGDVARAVLEGLCCELRVMLEDLERLTATPLRELRLVGGGAATNALWRRIKTDVTGRPLIAPDLVEAGCQGAALLAGLGAGVYADEAEACRRIRRVSESLTPDPEARAFYENLYQRSFQQLRPMAARLGGPGRGVLGIREFPNGEN